MTCARASRAGWAGSEPRSSSRRSSAPSARSWSPACCCPRSSASLRSRSSSRASCWSSPTSRSAPHSSSASTCPSTTAARRSGSRSGCGVVFTIGGYALSGPVAALYGQPAVKPLFAALSLSFLLTALGATQQSLLLREMDFKRLEGADGGRRPRRRRGRGRRSPRWTRARGRSSASSCITALVTSALMWRASAWRPRLLFSRASLVDLGSFSSYLVGHRLLYYLHQNADRFLIGRFLGAVLAGRLRGRLQRHARARGADRRAGPARPRARLRPHAGRARADRRRVGARHAARRRDRDPGARGRRRRRARLRPGRPRRAVARGDPGRSSCSRGSGILQALQAVNVDILMARDRTSTLFKYTAFFCTAHVLAFSVGLHWGVVGVAAAYAISSTLVEPVLTVLTARALGVSPWVFVRSVVGVAQAALAMGAVALAARCRAGRRRGARRSPGCCSSRRSASSSTCRCARGGPPRSRRDVRSLLGERGRAPFAAHRCPPSREPGPRRGARRRRARRHAWRSRCWPGDAPEGAHDRQRPKLRPASLFVAPTGDDAGAAPARHPAARSPGPTVWRGRARSSRRPREATALRSSPRSQAGSSRRSSCAPPPARACACAASRSGARRCG